MSQKDKKIKKDYQGVCQKLIQREIIDEKSCQILQKYDILKNEEYNREGIKQAFIAYSNDILYGAMGMDEPRDEFVTMLESAKALGVLTSFLNHVTDSIKSYPTPLASQLCRPNHTTVVQILNKAIEAGVLEDILNFHTKIKYIVKADATPLMVAIKMEQIAPGGVAMILDKAREVNEGTFKNILKFKVNGKTAIDFAVKENIATEILLQKIYPHSNYQEALKQFYNDDSNQLASLDTLDSMQKMALAAQSEPSSDIKSDL